MKEEADAAFLDEASESSSGSDSSSDSDSSDSSKSVFGFGVREPKAKGQAKRRASSKGSVSSKPASSNGPATSPRENVPGTSPASKPKPSPPEKKIKLAEPPKLVEAKAVYMALEQVTVASIWKSTMKAKEIAARVSRAVAAATAVSVEGLGMEPEEQAKASALAESLNEMANSITIMQDLTQKIQAGTATVLIQSEEFAAHFKHVLASLDFDAGSLISIVLHLAQRLAEARLQKQIRDQG
jgi:hypothetical protein